VLPLSRLTEGAKNNVLVSQEGEPQICDFGIAGIMTAEKDDSGSVSSEEPSGEVARHILVRDADT